MGKKKPNRSNEQGGQQQQQQQRPPQQQQQQQRPPQQQQQQQRPPQQQQQQQQQRPPQQQQQQQQQRPPQQQQQGGQQQQRPPQQQQQQQRPPQQQQQRPPQQQQQQRPPQQQQQQHRPYQQQQQRPPQQQQHQQRPPYQQQQQQQQRPGWGQQQQPQQQQQQRQPWGQQQQQQRPAGHQQQQQPQHPPQQQQRQPWGQQQQQPRPPQQQEQRPPPPQVQQQQRQSTPLEKAPSQTASASPSPSPSSSSSSVSQLSAASSKLAISEDVKVPGMITACIPKRVCKERPPKQGKGRKIVVETNHLPLKINNLNGVVHHYDVAFTPEKPVKFYRGAFEKVRLEAFPRCYPSFDGKKNIYSFDKLPLNGDALIHTVIIFDEFSKVQQREVTVKIQHVNTVKLSTIVEYMKNGSSLRIPQDAIQAIDIVLRQPSAKKFTQIGRSYFTEPGRVVELGDGLEIWYGFFQSAIIGQNNTYLNIDVAHRGFPMAIPCIEALGKFTRNPVNANTELQHYEKDNFLAFIKGLKVTYKPPCQPNQVQQKRVYTVSDVGLPPIRDEFTTQNEGPTTVYKYYQAHYNYSIRFPKLPNLRCGAPPRTISLPLELCEIVKGQVIMKKLNDRQTREMVRFAAVSAPQRKEKIMSSLRSVDFNKDPCIKEFGLSVAEEFTKVPARILAPPQLSYNNSTTNVSGGVWRNGKFFKSAELTEWAIYCTDNRTDFRLLESLAFKLIDASKSAGMVIQKPKQIIQMSNPRAFDQDITNFKGLQIVFVVIPEKGPISYAKVKQEAELRVGLLTQCLKSRTLTKLDPATATNILLKLNAKLNGLNHYINESNWPSFFRVPVIVFGADVTHPSHDQHDKPSVAAVSASHDPRAFCYNTIWKMQEAGVEIIESLQTIVKDQLTFFYKKTGYKPSAILFYRDGVSEGQFKKVIEKEVMAVRLACESLDSNYKPPITFVVVQKRHHTRLFPQNKDADGRNKNVPAGTIVDSDITHPTELDFYLVSHASIQGTSRPTKYHLLWDDSNMSEDDLEEITYYLCHLFTRCNRSVSYPAPTYYAHLSAFRVRSYLDKRTNVKQTSVDLTTKNPMYFV